MFGIICKNILKKLPCYHDNHSKYFIVGKGLCMHVFPSNLLFGMKFYVMWLSMG